MEEKKTIAGISEVNAGFGVLVESIKNEAIQYVRDTYGPIERKIVTVVDGKKFEHKGFLHEKFDKVLKHVSNNVPVYLSGPAGSGKNYLCKQVADSLGLKFYFSNAITQEYKLTGFTDAMGKFQETQFYKAFSQGGLFMLDEVDASIPDVLIILNAAISNGYFDFPAPIGYTPVHPDFRIIAAGNTSGKGATYDYSGRTRLDGSSLDRFAYVPIGYDKNIEDGLACDDKLAKFCRSFRASAEKTGVNIIVSYRAIERLAKMTQIMPLDEALESCLIKDLEKDDLKVILSDLPRTKYKDALQTIYDRM